MSSVPNVPENPISGGLARLLATVAAGALFGFGLALSRMIEPQVVLDFLRGRDLGLALVMGCGVVVAALGLRGLPRLLRRPLAAARFDVHPSTWSRNTVIGAALFGIGWGLTGVCPGPAIAGLGAGNWSLLWPLAGLALGAGLHGATASAPSTLATPLPAAPSTPETGR